MKIASNYATALVSAYKNDDLIEQLENLKKVFLNNTVKSFFQSKNIDKLIKFEVISSNFKNVQIQNYLKLIVENERMKLIEDILDQTYKLALENSSIKLVVVTLAIKPDENMKSSLENKLTKKYNTKLLIEYKIKPEIIGGIIIEENNKIIDNSILGKKNRLMQHILGGENV
jgi:F-type H+-transporting ATPase subunit delta